MKDKSPAQPLLSTTLDTHKICYFQSKLRTSLLNKGEFTLTFELVPGRGSRGKVHDALLAFAEKASAGGKIQALSLTENAGGHPALSPEVLGREIKNLGMETIVHFSCKDKNRNQIESLLFAWDREGIHNLLILTGDYPRYGYEGPAKPVFDLDSVALLSMVGQMKSGYYIHSQAPGGGRFPPSMPFFKGCVVSPFKRLESELMNQYFKLQRKAAAGADFVITQVGFDVRQFDALVRYMLLNGINLPILGNVYIPSITVARLMHEGKVPGCVVTDELMALYERESGEPDGGKEKRLLRAAKLLAVQRGLGYDGAHIGGSKLTYDDVEFIIGKSEDFYRNWPDYIPEFRFPQKDGFYYFEKDEKTGLNKDAPAKPESTSGHRATNYIFSRSIHNLVFDENESLFRPAKNFCQAIADTKWERPFAWVEYLPKQFLYECKKCGDCVLSEVAFLCPESQCAKYMRNGPCGGSIDGWCEVYPGVKKCIYVRAHERLRSYGQKKKLKEKIIPPRDWSLNNTSSWINFFTGRDYAGKIKSRKR
jgi:methylenetetrahydrofolate reductase (NADPH)